MKDSRKQFKTGFSEDKVPRLTDERLAMMKQVLLGMLRDFIEVADRHGIFYTLSGGSVLGAVRHGGFIPWDDDIDLNLPRADYDRLREIFAGELGEKYELCTPEDTPGHGISCAQIKKKGTIYKSFNELSKPNAGICMDLFVIENTPDNAFLRRLHGMRCLMFGYLLTCRKTSRDMPYLRPYLEEGSSIEKAFKKKARIGGLFGWLNLDSLTRRTASRYASCKNAASCLVTIPSGRKHYFDEMIAREAICERRSVRFEDVDTWIPADADAYLSQLYGPDYMTPPPEGEREQHPIMELDFGE